MPESYPNRSVAVQFRRACQSFDLHNKVKVHALTSALESITQELAQESVRKHAGSDQALWIDLRKLWRDLARSQLTFWDNDDSDNEEGSSSQNENLRSLCMALAKFTRNLVAGVSENQSRAYENEPEIRRLLHYYTSWSAMEDEESIATARVLTQALSNIVTSNQALVATLWETYMSLPEDQLVLIRLLSSPDERTLLTTLIFIVNCIHGSRKRTKLLAKSAVGARVCIALLDDMLRLYEAEEDTEGGRAFNVGYAIFTRLIEEGTVPDLYKKFNIPDEIVTPHQTTLLKLVDSYLQSIQLDVTSLAKSEVLQTHVALGPFLAKRFFTLSNYIQTAMHKSLEDQTHQGGSPSSKSTAGEASSTSQQTLSPPAELDIMLPKVCEALVLVTQCIVTIALEAEEHNHQFDSGSVRSISNMKDFFIDVRYSGQGLVENLIELLRVLDLFLPRINFGKPIPSPASLESASSNHQPISIDSTGFSYVKRDLVRLLGVLSHETRTVQDRTRNANGIPVVMNLCVIDERNPFLREHAIFTLHNLLKNNLENQAIVDAIKPSAEWDY